MPAAKLRAVPDQTNTYPYSDCRGGTRHQMEVVGPIPGRRRRSEWGTELVYRCHKCGTYRFDVISRLTADLLSRSYAHPDDYKWTGGPMEFKDWKLMWLDELDNALMLDLETNEPVPADEQIQTSTIAERNRSARKRNPR